MWRDMQRICASQGLQFSRPKTFPKNGLLAARIALALSDNAACAEFSRAVYHLEFACGGDISDRGELAKILSDLGYEPLSILARAEHPETKAALRIQTEKAQNFGIFGAPSWRTSDGEIFWGNDRLESALSWAERSIK